VFVEMQISSPAFSEGEIIPKKYTCLGPNISPPLKISDVPNSALSLVLIFEDLSASPKPWVHWLYYNIPVNTKIIAEGEAPTNAQEGLSNNNTFGYEGPCPKYFSKTHTYAIQLFALNLVLPNLPNINKDKISNYLANHTVAKAKLEGTQIGLK
jgi:Raf kinase inhibitor-like YbhB/YbcL family protein